MEFECGPIDAGERYGDASALHMSRQSLRKSDGPATLAEILDWAPQYLKLIAIQSPGMYRNIVAKLFETPLHVVTDYSGLGGPERALDDIIGALRGNFGVDAKIVFHRAREMNASCRKVLLCRTPPRGPVHVFGDIFEGMPLSIRRDLERLFERFQRKRRLSQNGARALRTCFADKLVAGVDKLIKPVKVYRDRKQFCYRCNQMCPVAPQSTRSLAIAGVTCTDFSKAGSRLGAGGRSYLCYAWWCHQTLVDQPALLVMECVAEFATELLARFSHTYVIATLDFSPLDLGIPIHRKRKYMMLRHLQHTAAHTDLEPTFQALFFRHLVANGDLYMAATTDQLRQEIHAAVIQRLGIDARRPEDLDGHGWEALMAPWQSRCLKKWLVKVGDHHSGYINIGQSVEYMKGEQCIKKWAPTLTTKSMLYSLSARRVVLLREMLLMHGIRDFEFESGVSSNAVRRMAGNGMHAASVGSMLLFALGGCDWTP